MNPNSTPKILIITYYWPPAGGPGVQRWLKFVKYLPEFGFEPIVYTPESPTYPIIDHDINTEIDKNIVVLKQKIFEPFQIASFFSKSKTIKLSSGIIPKTKNQSIIQKFLLYIRGNFFIPDARVFWVKPSIKYLEKYIQNHDISTIITTGPPHSVHLIGLGLKQNLNINWIADFRDPWTTIGYQKQLKLNKYSIAKHQKLESKVLNAVDQIIVTSPTTKVEFENLISKPIDVITNGYDTGIAIDVVRDAKFSIAHIGSFLSDRNPKILWEVLHELTIVNTDFAKHFELKLIGKISDEIFETISAFGLTKYINNLGYLSHNEAIEQQLKSQILLIIEIDSPETKCIIPGKIFEYLAAKRPIIAIGPKGSDMQEIVEKTNSGIFVDYSQKQQLHGFVLGSFQKFQNNNLVSNATGIEQYSRRNLTENLANLLLKNFSDYL